MANMKKLTRDYGEIIWTGKKWHNGYAYFVYTIHSHRQQADNPRGSAES